MKNIHDKYITISSFITNVNNKVNESTIVQNTKKNHEQIYNKFLLLCPCDKRKEKNLDKLPLEQY